MKIVGYEKKSIVTPLHRRGRIIGVFAMTSTELAKYFIPSVRNLSQHISTALDLAEEHAIRKQMEETLRESEEKYRMQFEEALDAIFVADAETGIIVDCNRAASELVGREKSELVGRHQRILHPLGEIEGEFSKTFKQHLKEREGQILETQVITKKGEIKDVAIKANIIELRGKKLIQGIFRDITERKRMEEALAYERDLLQALMDNVPDAIYFKDPISRFTRINRAHAQRMGLNDPEEAIGKKDFDFYEEKFAQEAYRDEQEIVRTGQPLIGKIEKIWMKDGKIRYVSATKVPIKDKKGRVIGVVGVSRDITNLKQMEEELRRYSMHLEELVEERTRKLREAERMAAIGETAAMVGHDLRNPLQVLVNTIYLLRKLSESEIHQYKEGAKNRDYVDLFRMIEDQVAYMNKIVADLQDYTRPVKPDFVETSVHQLINETLSTVTIPETVEVSKIIPEDLPRLMADPVLMKRVFTNLVTNALQAMPNGGQLTIKAHSKEQVMFIGFQDTGAGIPEENLPKLFRPLFTTKPKGAGFGLAVCKRLMEAHNGNITVESKMGKGSTFTVKLPLKKEAS